MKESSAPLHSFLNKSINIELVSVILLGINNFMDLHMKMVEKENLKKSNKNYNALVNNMLRKANNRVERNRRIICCCIKRRRI